MFNEVSTGTEEISRELVIDSDDKMFAYAMESLNNSMPKTEEKAETVVEDKPEDQSEVKGEVGEKAESVKEEPQAEPKAEEAKPETDTAKPETKTLYTAEEIETEIGSHGDLARLDSSRLSPEGKLIQASMQRGLTPKLQEAAELRKERDTLVQRIRVEEEKKAKEEAEKKYLEEKEQYGEEMANLFKKVRDLETKQQASDMERGRERQVFLAEQQKIAAQQFHYAFMEKAKNYGIPNTPQWEEMITSRILAENQIRSMNNEPFISIDDGMRLVADTVGLSDTKRLEDLLSANPKLVEALKIRFGQEAPKPKATPPTVIKSSSSGGSGKSEVKRTAAPYDKLLDKDINEWMVQEALALSKNPNQ